MEIRFHSAIRIAEGRADKQTMLLGPNPGAFKINLIMRSSRIITKYLAGFWKLSFVIEYEDRLP